MDHHPVHSHEWSGQMPKVASAELGLGAPEVSRSSAAAFHWSWQFHLRQCGMCGVHTSRDAGRHARLRQEIVVLGVGLP